MQYKKYFSRIASALLLFVLAGLVACSVGPNGQILDDQNKPTGYCVDMGQVAGGNLSFKQCAASAAATPGVGTPTVQATPGTSGTPTAQVTPGAMGACITSDGRSCDPRTTNPLAALNGQQPYQDTGIGKTSKWDLTVPTGWTLLIFGVTVDTAQTGRHTNGGIYAFPAGQKVSATVTDGGYVFKSEVEAYPEFCNRIAQHRANNWLLTDIQPLQGWNKCW